MRYVSKFLFLLLCLPFFGNAALFKPVDNSKFAAVVKDIFWINDAKAAGPTQFECKNPTDPGCGGSAFQPRDDKLALEAGEAVIGGGSTGGNTGGDNTGGNTTTSEPTTQTCEAEIINDNGVFRKCCKQSCPEGSYTTLMGCTVKNNDGCKKSGSCYVPFTCDDVTSTTFFGYSRDGGFGYLDVRLSASAENGYTTPTNTYVKSFKDDVNGTKKCFNTLYVDYEFENSEYTEDDNARFESEGIGSDLSGKYYYSGSEGNGSCIFVGGDNTFYSADDGLSRGGLYINGEKCYWSVTNSVYESQAVNDSSNCSDSGGGSSGDGENNYGWATVNITFLDNCFGSGSSWNRTTNSHNDRFIVNAYNDDEEYIGTVEGVGYYTADVFSGSGAVGTVTRCALITYNHKNQCPDGVACVRVRNGRLEYRTDITWMVGDDWSWGTTTACGIGAQYVETTYIIRGAGIPEGKTTKLNAGENNISVSCSIRNP